MSPKDLFTLEGKVAIIPGGSGGIGSTLAAGVCEAGASVAIVDRDGDGLTRTCSRMREAGSEPLAIAADLTKKEDADRAVAETMDHFGRGGKVVNISSVRGQLGINAGYSAFVAAKGAANSLTRQWATEWAKHGITVNAIAPPSSTRPRWPCSSTDPDFKGALPVPSCDGPERLPGVTARCCRCRGTRRYRS